MNILAKNKENGITETMLSHIIAIGVWMHGGGGGTAIRGGCRIGGREGKDRKGRGGVTESPRGVWDKGEEGGGEGR